MRVDPKIMNKWRVWEHPTLSEPLRVRISHDLVYPAYNVIAHWADPDGVLDQLYIKASFPTDLSEAGVDVKEQTLERATAHYITESLLSAYERTVRA